jgi:type VII secretion-associated serine protease mycosin
MEGIWHLTYSVDRLSAEGYQGAASLVRRRYPSPVTTVRRRHDRLKPVMHGLTAGTLLAAVTLAAAPATALAQAECDRELDEVDVFTDTPWPQDWFGLDRLSPPPRANGITVAVIDSGVEDSHPQLAGRVLDGFDLVEDGGPDGRIDCAGHGTGVASVIAADDADDTGFAGLAPGATILPIRVTEQDPDTSDTSRQEIPADRVAEAITLATDQDVDIINISIAFPTPSAVLGDAIEYALADDVIVVAAAGNQKSQAGGVDPPAFPASYEGVVSVGAITPEGSRDADRTYVGPGVDLLAPGADVVLAWPAGGHVADSGTSFAAPFVSAAAALVLASNPDLSGPEVVDRLIATADPGPGSAISYAGVVNPYRALTGRVADGEPVAIAAPSEPPPDPAAVARAERWERDTQRAVVIMVIAMSLTVLGFTGAAVWRRGERHRWRPGQRRDPVFPHPIVDEPERRFYTVPTPRQRR